MKNLKRVLSLALATVMVIGMMVVGANAAFSDQSSIKYDDAVNTLVGLGVINGMGDNTFAPNGTLTRAQAAKMIAYVKAGANTTTVGYYDGATKFTDVGANHSWASGSINYCVANNIIAGMSATTFEPDANLTGAQLAKMLIVALGYPANSKKDTESLTGANWQLNAIRKATTLGLFDKLDSSFSATRAVTREEACQIIFNALGVNTLTVKQYDADGNPIYADSNNTLLEEAFKATATDAVVTANQATGNANTVVTVKGTSKNLDFKTGLELIGHAVTYYTNKDGKVLAVVDKATHVATVTTAATGTQITAAVAKANGFTKADITKVEFSHNYAAASEADLAASTNTILISNTPANETTGLYAVDFVIQTDASIYKVYTDAYKTVDKDGEITAVYYGTKNQANPTAISGADKLTTDKTNANVIVETTIGTAKSVEVCTATTATLTAITDSTTFTVGGTNYTKLNADGADSMPTAADLGKEIVIYTTANGALAHAKGVSAVITYAYVAQFGEKTLTGGTDLSDGTKTLVADVYFADGSHTVYPVNVESAKKIESGLQLVELNKKVGLYQYEVNAKGEIVLSSITDAGVTGITKGISKVTAAGNVYANDKTVIFYVNGEYGNTENPLSVTVVTGIANAVSATTGNGVTIQSVATGSPAVLSTVVVKGASMTTGSKALYFFAGGKGDFSLSQTGANEFTATYKVYDTTGKQITLTYKSTKTVATPAANTFLAEDATGSALVSAAKTGSVVNSVETVGYYNGSLTLKGDPNVEIQTGSAPVIDLVEGGSEGLYVDGKTTTIAIAYTSTDNVNNATVIFVLSQVAAKG